MGLFKTVFTVRMPVEDRIVSPAVAMLRIIVILVFTGLSIWDLIVNLRYAKVYTSGVASVHTETVPGSRFPPQLTGSPADPPAYCTANYPGYSMSNVFMQSAMGRHCMDNYTCDRWFHDQLIFKGGSNEWKLLTAMAGIPTPAQLPNPDDFDASFFFWSNFSTLNTSQKDALYDRFFNGAHKFNCSQGYYVERAEDVTIMIAQSFDGGGIGGIDQVQAMKTTVFDSDGEKIAVFAGGEPVVVKLSALFKIAWDETHPSILNTKLRTFFEVPEAVRPTFANYTTRTVGLRAGIKFQYTNIFNSQLLNSEVQCEIRPTVDNTQFATIEAGFFPLEDMTTRAVTPEPFTARGLLISVSTSSALYEADFYGTLLHFVSLSVLLQGINFGALGLVTLLRLLGKVVPDPEPEYPDQEKEELVEMSDQQTSDGNPMADTSGQTSPSKVKKNDVDVESA